MTEVIKDNGEYDQEAAEKSNTEEPQKSGVQINIDETNAANDKVNTEQLPASFDKTEAGKEAHQRKFGGERATEGGETTLTQQRKNLKRNAR